MKAGLSSGDYWLYTDLGMVSFTVYDDAAWPYQPTLAIDTRAFNVDLAVDDQHNVYATGWFEGTITLLNTYSVSVPSTYLAQLSQCGIVQWDLNIKGTSLCISCKVNAIHVTNDQHIIMCGDWNTTGPATLMIGSQSLTATSPGNFGFIAKFDRSNGSYIWAVQIKDASNAIQTKDITSDDNENIFVLGDFDSPIPGINLQDQPYSTTYHPLPAVGVNDIFLAAYDRNGKFIDAKDKGLSDPFNNDYAGGLVTVSSHYPSVPGILVGGIQRDQYAFQLHPYAGGLPVFGDPNSDGVLFIDNFCLYVPNSNISTPPFPNLFSICDPLYPGTVISDNDPTYFDEGYVGLCCDNNQQSFFSGNIASGIYSFIPAAGWGSVGPNPSSSFFIARIINNVISEIEFKNSIVLPGLKTVLNFSITPNPAKESAYINSKDADATIQQIEILEPTGRIVLTHKNTINKFPAEIDISNLLPGMFIVKIYTSSFVETIKMIVQ